MEGKSNTIKGSTANKNKAIGFDVAGAATGSTLKDNKSNNGSSGGSSENVGVEYKFGTSISNGGGSNKKDGVTFTTVAAGSYE